MRQVVSDSEIPHLWANQVQEYATNQRRSFYFNGKTIYSYGSHFPIAKHVEFEGKKAVLFTTRSYSNTTATHIGEVRSSCNHKEIIYCNNPEDSHKSNLDNFLYRIEEASKPLARGRKPEIHINRINYIIGEIEKYIEFFHLDVPVLLKQAMSITDTDKYQEYIVEKSHILLQEQKKEEERVKKAAEEQLKDWLTGERSSMWMRSVHDYLRLLDGENIETSQGVKLSVEMGKHLFNKIKENTLMVGDKVLYYRVDKADKKEYKIGCHTFPRKYLLEWGAKHLVV